MSWGLKIIIGMVSFIVFILGLGWLMITSGGDGLVDHNYYEKGIQYDEEYQMKQRVIRDDASPEINISGKLLTVKFRGAATGQARLICLADQTGDRKIAFSTSTNNLVKINSGSLQKGAWRVRINWESNGVHYLDEKEIVMQ